MVLVHLMAVVDLRAAAIEATPWDVGGVAASQALGQPLQDRGPRDPDQPAKSPDPRQLTSSREVVDRFSFDAQERGSLPDREHVWSTSCDRNLGVRHAAGSLGSLRYHADHLGPEQATDNPQRA